MKNNLIKILMLVVAGFIGMNGDGQTAYITNRFDNTVSVIKVATHTVTSTIHVGGNPTSIAVSLDGNRVYVSNSNDNTVSVISTAADSVVATINVGNNPVGIAVLSLELETYTLL